MQVAPFLSPTPAVHARADRQDASKESAFDSVYEVEDRAGADRYDAAESSANQPSEHRERDRDRRGDESDDVAKPTDAAATDEADSAVAESPAEGSDFDTGEPVTEPTTDTDPEAAAAAPDSSDASDVAIADGPARPTTAKAEVTREAPAARSVPTRAPGAPAATPEAPVDAADTPPPGQPAAATTNAGAAPQAAARPLEAEQVVIRRVRADDTAEPSDDAAPRVDTRPRDTEIRAPKPVIAATESLARPPADAAQPAADAGLAEVGATESRSPAEHVARAEATPRHDTPRPLMTQVTDAARALRDGPVELTLKPEELGKVRMTMTAGADGTMTMSLHADRPETLDLLRRHIGELARELTDLGFSNLSFSFGHDRAQAGHNLPQGVDVDDPADDSIATVPLAGPSLADRPSMAPASGGLDLRL